GPARLVRIDQALPPSARRGEAASLLSSPALLGLLHGAAALLGGAPRRVWAGAAGAGLLTLLLGFPAGRAAQGSVWAARGGRPPRPLCGPAAARGAAVAGGRRRPRGRDGAGEHAEHLPRRPLAQVLLERFVRAVRGGRPPHPDLPDAYRALLALRAA